MHPLRLFLFLSLIAIELLPVPGLRAEAPASPAPFAPEEFLAALSRDLASHFNLEGDLQLELLRPLSPVRPVAAGWTITVLDYPAEPASSMLVRCRVSDADGVAMETSLLLHAALWRDTWVVRLPLTVGSVFDPSRLESRRSDVLRQRELLPATVGDHTYVFSRAVPAGRPLTWHDIARRPLVRKGELVEVTAAEGLLVVSMKALALENGAQGETVTVRNLESRKDFPAIVTDENHVQIHF
jgi:flagellar basal body P-ring formation protein FlgA